MLPTWTYFFRLGGYVSLVLPFQHFPSRRNAVRNRFVIEVLGCVFGPTYFSSRQKSVLYTSLHDKRYDFNFHFTHCFIRFWEAIFHLRQPMAFLSQSSYGMPGHAPLINVLFLGRCDFYVSFSCWDMSGNVCNRLSGDLCSILESHHEKKEGDLTQTYDKSPYTNRKKNPKNKVTTQKRLQNIRLHNECGPI